MSKDKINKAKTGYNYSNAESQNLFKEWSVFLVEITKHIEERDEHIGFLEKEILGLEKERANLEKEIFVLSSEVTEIKHKLDESRRIKFMIRDIFNRLPRTFLNIIVKVVKKQ